MHGNAAHTGCLEIAKLRGWHLAAYRPGFREACETALDIAGTTIRYQPTSSGNSAATSNVASWPMLPVRQWVLSLPKRLRYFLCQDRKAVTAVLNIFLRVVEQTLREHASGNGEKTRLGAVSFVHRFGSAHNEHLHFHCCVIDGVFEPAPEGEEAVRFHEAFLTQAAIQAVPVRVRRRVLRWFAARAYLDKDDAKEMAQWGNGGGFSVDASVRIEGHDRAGLERLLRYCARPPFALERLEPRFLS